MRIWPSDLPDDAVPTLPVLKRRADTLNAVAEKRVQCRASGGGTPAASSYHRRAPGFEYRLIGGSAGWWHPRPEIDYPGGPGYLGEFFVAGAVDHTRELHAGDWAQVFLTQAGEFLFSLWLRDRDREREARQADRGEPGRPTRALDAVNWTV